MIFQKNGTQDHEIKKSRKTRTSGSFKVPKDILDHWKPEPKIQNYQIRII